MANISYVTLPSYRYNIIVTNTPVTGQILKLTVRNGNTGLTFILSSYTTLAGDTLDEIVTGLYNSTNAAYRESLNVPAESYYVDLSTILGRIVSATSTPPPSPPPPPPPSQTVVTTTGTVTTTYGQIFQGTFDPIKDNPVSPVYTVKIYKKGYDGQVQSIKLSTTPAIHSYQTDEPKAAIKGSALLVNLLNLGSLPLKTFYASEDDTFMGELYWFDKVLFKGFLVQDDCSELLVDYTHEIQLSFTDNLGLLKDINFDKAAANFYVSFSSGDFITTTAVHTITLTDVWRNSFIVGDRIRILGGTAADGLYNITALQLSGGYLIITVAETIVTMSSQLVGFTGYRSNVYEKKTLAQIVHACLLATGLELEIYVYSNLRETTQLTTRSFLEQTLIIGESFMKSETDWEDCYSVLTKIFEKFNLTLFQSHGRWNIIRWDELRYGSNVLTNFFQVNGFRHDKDFNYIEVSSSGAPFTIQPFNSTLSFITYPENGYLNKISRPYKLAKETFNYRQPGQILKNANLQILGTLLRQYTTGTIGTANYRKIFEYSVSWWTGSEGFIRVVKDQFDNELERFLVIKSGFLKSYKIEVNKGDKFTFSFDVKMNSTATSYELKFAVELTDGTLTKYIINYFPIAGEPPYEPGAWHTSPGFKFGTNNVSEYHTVTINSPTIPFDGLLHVYLPWLAVPSGIGGTHETHYKDISFTYTSYINESVKITGHTHTDVQPLSIKNKGEEEIYLDDAPKNSLAGTLFLPSLTGLLQTRTTRWTRAYTFNESKRLGEITTFETLFWKQKPRTILEGRIYGLVQQNVHMSMLTQFLYLGRPDTESFVWGRMEIDYKNNHATGTIWENNNLFEGRSDNLIQDYSFDYIYAPL